MDGSLIFLFLTVMLFIANFGFFLGVIDFILDIRNGKYENSLILCNSARIAISFTAIIVLTLTLAG
jgi:energy-coupling factor transporter transmembrane protein EcfT